MSKAVIRALIIEIGIKKSHEVKKEFKPDNTKLYYASSFLDVVDIIHLEDVHVIVVSDFRGQKATVGYIKMFKTTNPNFKVVIMSNNRVVTDTYASYFIQRGADSVVSCYDTVRLTERFSRIYAAITESEIIKNEWTKCTKRSIRFIKNNYHIKSKLIDKLSDAIGYSASSISHSVKADTGENVTEWIQKLRVKASLELLESTDHPIKMIGELVGYGSEQGYIKVFKKIMGMTPTAYRKQFY